MEKQNIETMKFPEGDSPDLLQRRNLADNIIRLFSSKESNFSPLILNGVWGSRKTVFCHQLKNLIQDNHKDTIQNVVYINAFMLDYADDPFCVITGNILEGIQDWGDTIKQQLLVSAGKIALFGTKVVMKAGIAWLLKQGPDDVINGITEATKNEAHTAIDNIFSSFGKATETITEFKKILKKILKDRNILIIVDELDRCKPTFALGMLERIKHIFDVKGLHFLLSMDTQALTSTIKKQYGYEINAEEYLSKFYTYKVNLPKTVEDELLDTIKGKYYTRNTHSSVVFFRKQMEQDSMKIYKNLVVREGTKFSSQKNYEDILLLWQWCIENSHNTLRDVGKFLLNIQLYYTLHTYEKIIDNSIYSMNSINSSAGEYKQFTETSVTKIPPDILPDTLVEKLRYEKNSIEYQNKLKEIEDKNQSREISILDIRTMEALALHMCTTASPLLESILNKTITPEEYHNCLPHSNDEMIELVLKRLRSNIILRDFGIDTYIPIYNNYGTMYIDPQYEKDGNIPSCPKDGIVHLSKSDKFTFHYICKKVYDTLQCTVKIE